MNSTVIWTHQYTPIADSLGLSASVAALPILALVLMLAVLRRPAWQAAVAGLVTAMVIALFVYGMPAGLMMSCA